MPVDAISELDMSYTPPLGSPWDAVQVAAQAWVTEYDRPRVWTPSGGRGSTGWARTRPSPSAVRCQQTAATKTVVRCRAS